MTVSEAKKLAKRELSPRRYAHTANVAAAAKVLALRWGQNPQKAMLAAWLHDIVKERSKEDLLRILALDDIMAKATVSRPLPVWHGPAAAVYARHRLGVTDLQVLSAIACHTTGKAKMTVMDKILFIADAAGDDRAYRAAPAIRILSETDIDAAVIAAMEESLRYLLSAGKEVDGETQKALAAMRESANEDE